MAGKRGGLFGLLENAIVDLRETLRVNWGKKQPPTTPTPPNLPTEPGDIVVPPKAPSTTSTPQTTYKDEEKPGFKSQIEQWLEQNPPLPETESTESESQAPIPSFRTVPPTAPVSERELEQEGSRLASRLREKHQRQAYILRLAVRPKTDFEAIVDGFKNSFLSFLPFLPQPMALEERVAQAINQLALQNPELAQSEELRSLKKENTKQALVKDITNTTTGQVKELRFIPPQRFEQEQHNLGPRDNLLRINFDTPNFLRITQEGPLNRFGDFGVRSAIQQAAGSAGKNAVSQAAIAGRGLVGTVARGLGANLTRTALGLGRFLVVLGGGGEALAVGGGVTIALAVVVGFLIFQSNTGPIFTQRAATVGGGPGDQQPKGNEFVAITIVSSKSSIPNNGLPTDVQFDIKVTPKKDPFEGSPDIQAKIITSPNSRTLLSDSWNDEQKEIKIDLPSDLTDSLVTLSVTVNVRIQGQTDSQTALGSSTVRIGNPPTACPSGWPTKGYIDQGPDGTYSHVGSEAIDIEGTLGQPIYTSLDGTAVPFVDQYGGKDIRITTKCDGRDVWVDFVHFTDYAIKGPTPVKTGDIIGYMGHTGFANTDHLHYQFGGIKMEPPYIPLPVPRKCVGRKACGNIEF